MAQPQRKRSTPWPSSMSAEEAIILAQKRGEETPTTKDAGGQELVQRPISLSYTAPVARDHKKDAAYVKVYHKRQTSVWLSDGSILGPEEEGYIPLEDFENPAIAPYVLKLAP